MVPQNRLLDEENVAAGLLHLLGHVENVGSLLTQDSVHRIVVRHDHLIIHLYSTMEQ